MLTQQTTDPNPLLEKEQQLLSVLLAVRNPQQRLATVVEQARTRAPLDSSLRTEAHRVPGCLVRTWFVAELRGGRCHFRCDSDAAMLKAVIGLLCDLYSGFTPEELLSATPDFLQKVGVIHQLADNRQRTVLRVAAQIVEFARAQLAVPA